MTFDPIRAWNEHGVSVSLSPLSPGPTVSCCLGGCFGAIARYSLSGLAHRWTSCAFPVGTLLVNVLGCFAIGVAMGLIEDKNVLGPTTRLFLVIGFLGSFTTFSSLGYETVEMLNDGQLAAAALNAVGNYGLGIGAVVLGRLLVRAVIA